jgi:hypothetical protein
VAVIEISMTRMTSAPGSAALILLRIGQTGAAQAGQ